MKMLKFRWGNGMRVSKQLEGVHVPSLVYAALYSVCVMMCLFLPDRLKGPAGSLFYRKRTSAPQLGKLLK